MPTLTDAMREGKNVDFNNSVDFMHFTLTYDGPLPSCSKDARIGPKFDIRRQLHPQLVELCRTHPALEPAPTLTQRPLKDSARINTDFYISDGSPPTPPTKQSWFENWQSIPHPRATVRVLNEFSFIPVFPIKLFFVCELSVLFLRRSGAASVIQGGGDIDNRIATLFDALRVPQDRNQLPKAACPQPGETPFFCLLEDDGQIVGVSIKTDRLLTPMGVTNCDDVRLVLDVNIQATRLTWDTIDTVAD